MNAWKILVVLMLGHVSLLEGQNAPQYSQFSLNPYIHNPASAGMTYSIEAQVGHRSQWVRNEYAPKDYFFSITTPFFNLGGAGGFVFEQRSVGLERIVNLEGSYSWVWSSFGGQMALAGRLGVSNLKFHGDQVITPSGTYEGGLVNHNDIAIPGGEVGRWAMSGDVGVWYQNKNMRLGVSVDNLFHSGFQVTDKGTITPNSVYSVLGNYAFNVNKNFRLLSGIILKFDGTVVQSQFNSYLRLNNKVTFGVSFIGFSDSSKEELGVTVGIRISEFLNFYYTYGFGLNKVSVDEGGTHEVILQFDLGRSIQRARIPIIEYNTRFLE